MRLLIPFDIVPVDTRVPQSALGVAPASERAIRYALDVVGDDEVQVTALHFATETIDLEENMGAAEIRMIADKLGVAADVDIHSVQDVDSMAGLREEILRVVEEEGIDTVVMGYEDRSFADSVFSESTPARILEDQDTPVVLVP